MFTPNKALFLEGCVKKIKTKSTSTASAVVDPIVLRENSIGRLIFKPLIINNPHDSKATIKGEFVFQRKTKDQEWLDMQAFSLAKLKAGESIKLKLHSAEVLKLYMALSDLYALYQQEGVPLGEKRFLQVDGEIEQLFSIVNEQLPHLLDEHPDDALALLSRLLQWILHADAADQMIEYLEQLDADSLRQLNSSINLNALKSSYAEWESNQANPDEEYWQNMLSKYSFVLSQIFPYPIIIFEEKAYIGGKIFSNKGGNIVDFLAKDQIGNNAILIEIKTPNTKLLGAKYRSNVYSISKDISGAITQVVNYKHHLQRDFYHTFKNEQNIKAFEPLCVVIAGNYEQELKDEDKISSFELFRSHLSGVSIITYDELFGKIKLLIELLENR